MTKRFLVCLSFKGTAYCGWQVQKNGLSIQSVVQDAIEKILKYRANIVACSRTDAGVHAINFYFHIDISIAIEPDKFKYALNLNLPDDVSVNFVKIVNETFHARYNAIKKEYVYKIWNSKVKNPFLENLVWHYNRTLNLKQMELAANCFIGTFDFSSFCSVKSKVKNKTRTIFEISLLKKQNLVEISLIGNGFLHNMVRIIIGTLIEVSEGLIEVKQIQNFLKTNNRDETGRTVPAKGLYLKQVFYNF